MKLKNEKKCFRLFFLKKKSFSSTDKCMFTFIGFMNLLIMPGGHSEEVIPVPIPNTEVKLFYADDTVAKRESRMLPGFFLPFIFIDFVNNA